MVKTRLIVHCLVTNSLIHIRLIELTTEQAVSDAELEATKAATETARKHTEERRAARRQATRDVDLHP